MKTAELQKALLEEIAKELQEGNVPLKRLREVAKEAIVLSEKYPSDIPPDAMKELIRRFPEITLSIRGPLREESDRKDKDEADEIRKTLGLQH